MAKSRDIAGTITVKVDPSALLPLFESMRDDATDRAIELNKFIKKIKGGEVPSETPEIYLIDAAALPAAYYLRDSVQEAILSEIRKDYEITKQLPPGASLSNQVEARDGKTEEISSPEDDNSERGTGSADPDGSGDNGTPAGGSDPDPSGPRG